MNSFFQRGIDKGYFKGDVNSEYINKTLAAVLIFFVKYSASQEEAAEKIREVLRYILFGCINTEGQKPKE
jgi:hypothetical protein